MSAPANVPATDEYGEIERVVIGGDLSSLKPKDRIMYYKQVCESVGLNPLTKPFEYITLNGKLTLYAKRDATDQLRRVHGVSIKIVAREKVDDLYIVTAQATDGTGRCDESVGAVNLSNLKGESAANGIMKAETKAKRRVTLSICGLGMLDETEVAICEPSVDQSEKITDQQAADLESLLTETKSDKEAFLRYLSKNGKVTLGSLADMPAVMFKDAVAALEAKRKK